MLGESTMKDFIDRLSATQAEITDRVIDEYTARTGRWPSYAWSWLEPVIKDGVPVGFVAHAKCGDVMPKAKPGETLAVMDLRWMNQTNNEA